MVLLTPIFGLLLMEKPWSMISRTTVKHQQKQPCLRHYLRISKKRGFKFTGPVAVLSYLQAAGLVDDHENDCEWKGLK